jgi:hypothetical protein
MRFEGLPSRIEVLHEGLRCAVAAPAAEPSHDGFMLLKDARHPVGLGHGPEPGLAHLLAQGGEQLGHLGE